MKKKRLLVTMIGAVSILCSAVAFGNTEHSVVQASGTTESVFKMTSGGSVRIAEPYGLRFQVKMSEDVKNSATKVGMFIFPADYLTVKNREKAAVELNFNKGTVANTGTDTSVEVGSYVMDATTNGTAFNATDAVSYAAGRDGSAGGAIITNHKNGPYAVVKNYGFGTNDFTVSTWFNTENAGSIGDNAGFYLFGTNHPNTGKGFSVCIKKLDSGQFQIRLRATTQDTNTTTTFDIPDVESNTWYNVTAVREGAELKIYFAGSLVGTYAVNSYDFGTKDLAFGGYYGFGNEFHGVNTYFDDIQVYEAGLSAAKIQELIISSEDVYSESVEEFLETASSNHRIDLDLTSKLYKKGDYWYGNGAIVNIKEKNMAREFIGIAYYEVDGVKTWADTSNIDDSTRSVAQVSLRTLADKTYTYSETAKKLLVTYMDHLKSADVEDNEPTRYKVRGYAEDDGLRFNVVQYVDTVITGSNAWTTATHLEAKIWQHNIGRGAQYGLSTGTDCVFWLDGSTWFEKSTNIKKVTNNVTITDRGNDYSEGYRYEICYEIFINFDNNLDNTAEGPYAYVQFKHHMPGETKKSFKNSYMEYKDAQRYLWQDNCNSYEFREAGIIGKESRTEIEDELSWDFPRVNDFSDIESNFQSADPDLYNFQMWTADNGFYGYFVQTLPTENVVSSTSKQDWSSTHVEMNFYNNDMGKGSAGTYIALFQDETVYMSGKSKVRNILLKVNETESDTGYTTLEYYFYLEFDNNTASGRDPSYANVKLYQCMPGYIDSAEDATNLGLSSQVVTYDGRQLVTGSEELFEVHENGIDGSN